MILNYVLLGKEVGSKVYEVLEESVSKTAYFKKVLRENAYRTFAILKGKDFKS